MMREPIHIVPLNDLREHDTRTDCWCRPVPEWDAPHIFVHHCADGRDLIEKGERCVQ
jgi:hypothetical protein